MELCKCISGFRLTRTYPNATFYCTSYKEWFLLLEWTTLLTISLSVLVSVVQYGSVVCPADWLRISRISKSSFHHWYLWPVFQSVSKCLAVDESMFLLKMSRMGRVSWNCDNNQFLDILSVLCIVNKFATPRMNKCFCIRCQECGGCLEAVTVISF